MAKRSCCRFRRGESCPGRMVCRECLVASPLVGRGCRDRPGTRCRGSLRSNRSASESRTGTRRRCRHRPGRRDSGCSLGIAVRLTSAPSHPCEPEFRVCSSKVGHPYFAVGAGDLCCIAKAWRANSAALGPFRPEAVTRPRLS